MSITTWFMKCFQNCMFAKKNYAFLDIHRATSEKLQHIKLWKFAVFHTSRGTSSLPSIRDGWVFSLVHLTWNDPKHLQSQTNPIHFLQSHLNIILISLYHIKSWLQVYQQNLYINFSPLSCMIDVPTSSSSCIPSSQYLTRTANCEATHYALSKHFTIFPLSQNTLHSLLSANLHLSHSHISPRFCTSSTKQHEKLQFWIF
jgi:hypothetical protein